MTLSLAVTHYNRFEYLQEAISSILDDDRLSEIVISDDHSDEKIFNKVKEYYKSSEKVKIFRNDTNVGMGLNKKLAIERATSEWVIILDDDNILMPEYITSFLGQNHFPNVIYCPEFAHPKFNFAQWKGWYISKHSVKYFLSRGSMPDCFMNTCNYVVNRERYLQVCKPNAAMKAADTIWFNYLWLQAGNMLFVTPGMHYFHRDHPGSGFRKDIGYNMDRAKEMKEKIKAL